MAVFNTLPTCGPALTAVVKDGQAWYDGPGRLANGLGQARSPQTGDVAFGTDGREYVWVEASATIAVAAAPGTQITLTRAADKTTAAAGAGGFYAPTSTDYTGTIVTGDHFWAAKGTTA